jgi:hypothetical protein
MDVSSLIADEVRSRLDTLISESPICARRLDDSLVDKVIGVLKDFLPCPNHEINVEVKESNGQEIVLSYQLTTQFLVCFSQQSEDCCSPSAHPKADGETPRSC